MADEQTIGTHTLRIQGDTVLVRWIGIPELADVRATQVQFERVFADHGRLFVINDMRHSGLPSTQTRQWIAKSAQQLTIAGIVNFGASLPIRALQSLILRASTLLGRAPTIQVCNCGSEAEAFAWIAAHRRRLP